MKLQFCVGISMLEYVYVGTLAIDVRIVIDISTWVGEVKCPKTSRLNYPNS